MNKPLAITIGLIVLVVLVLFSTTYSVTFHEAAVQKRFGQPERVVTEPGLQFKLPIFADQVSKYDTRLQMLESPLETIATADDQQVLVRAYLLWRVDAERVQDFDVHRSMEAAADFINDRFKSALTAGLSRYRFNDLLGPDSRLKEAESSVRDELDGLRATGIEPVAVGISQVVFPQRTSRAVLTRMQATRETLARSERSKGQAEAQRIDSEAQAMADRIIAFAQQRAAEIRAAGDEEAARYMAQLGEHRELAMFLVQLDALEAALSERATLILETGDAPWHFLDFKSPLSAHGIPQPARMIARSQERQALEAALAELSRTSSTSGNPAERTPQKRDAEGATDVDTDDKEE